MSTRHVLTLIVVLSTATQMGCVCRQNLSGGSCAQAYDSCCASCGVPEASCCCPDASCGCPEPACGCSDTCCDVSCGCPDASCGCPDASCGCPDASCGCPESCGGGVGCGSQVVGQCPLSKCRLLQRMGNALRRCSSPACSSPAYYSEWQDAPPCDSDPCDCYGNHTGGPYGSPHGRRANLAKRHLNFDEESGNTYR